MEDGIHREEHPLLQKRQIAERREVFLNTQLCTPTKKNKQKKKKKKTIAILQE